MPSLSSSPAQALSVVLADQSPHRLSLIVYGTPAPQGSKTRVGRRIIHDNAEALLTWREDVKLAALRALDVSPRWDRDYPQVAAHIVFTLARPRHHYRTGKFAHVLRDNAPQFHGTKPDLDKLLRSTGDALTAAGVYTDDCRIAQVFGVKTYATAPTDGEVPRQPGGLDRPGARIMLTGMGR
jgi:Endodeoxyribonuclease RusA